MLIRRVARPMLGSIFITAGIDSLRNPAPRAEAAHGFIDQAENTLPNSVTDKVPSDAETLVRINGAVQVGAGTLLALSKYPRAASLVLAGSLVPTTLAGHAFWNETDPAARAQQRLQFTKNLSILGGLLIASVDTEGKPSLAWRGRRKATEAGHAIAAALPSTQATESTWDSIVERSQEGAHLLGEKSTEAAEVVRQRAPEIAETARKRSSVLADEIRHRAPGLAETARERSAELAEAARERSADLADEIRHRAPGLADAARERSADLADEIRHRAPELAEAARGKSADLADEVAALAATARDKASEGADEGRRRWRKARS